MSQYTPTRVSLEGIYYTLDSTIELGWSAHIGDGEDADKARCYWSSNGDVSRSAVDQDDFALHAGIARVTVLHVMASIFPKPVVTHDTKG